MRVEMDALGSPSLEVPTVSVDVKQHLKNEVGDPLGRDKQKSAFAPLLPYHFNACPEITARSVSSPLSLEYCLENWTALGGPTRTFPCFMSATISREGGFRIKQ